MAGVKYQIFISSTYEDLREEREQVIKAVLEMGHIPVGMEMFSAADEEQWKIIARNIDESDYYIAIAAHRYGSMTGGMSYTRKEYEYARSEGLPILGFLIDEQASWPADRIDKSEPEKGLLDDFKRLMREKPVGTWTSSEDLHGKFSVALMKAITANPREGWVRSSTTAGPQVTSELSRLSAENARLRQELATAELESAADRESMRTKTLGIMRSKIYKMAYRYTSRGDWEDAVEITMGRLFELLAPLLTVEYSVEDCARFVAIHVQVDQERRGDIIPLNHMSAALSDMMALDLVQPSTRRHSVADRVEYWSLTENGVELLKQLRKRALEAGLNAEPDQELGRDAGQSEAPKKATAKRAPARKATAKKATRTAAD